MARQPEAGHEPRVTAVHRELLQAIVAAICHDERGLRPARIHPYAVRLVELPWLRALAAERPDVRGVPIVLIDEVRSVSVANIDVAVRSDCDVRRVVRRRRAIAWRFVL